MVQSCHADFTSCTLILHHSVMKQPLFCSVTAGGGALSVSVTWEDVKVVHVPHRLFKTAWLQPSWCSTAAVPLQWIKNSHTHTYAHSHSVIPQSISSRADSPPPQPTRSSAGWLTVRERTARLHTQLEPAHIVWEEFTCMFCTLLPFADLKQEMIETHEY